MNRSSLWLILIASVAFHLSGALLLHFWRVQDGVHVYTGSPAPEPTVFDVSSFAAPGPAADEAFPTDTSVTTPSPLPVPIMPTANTAAGSSPSLRTMDSLRSHLETASLPFDAGASHRTIVFVLDKSGSMYEKVGGVKRVDMATQELRKMIMSLDRRSQFSVVLYSEAVSVFKPEPVFASAEAKLEALRFLDQDDSFGGSTDFPVGYQAALAMKPDAILLLTDGEFNAPESTLLAQARSLRERYRASAPLNVLGFLVRPDTNASHLLPRLCSENHGELQLWKRGAAVRFAFLNGLTTVE